VRITWRRLLGVALFLAVSRVASPQDAVTVPTLRIDIVFGGEPMTTQFEASALEETTRIWASYGVDVRDASSDATREDAIRLDVVLARRARPQVAAGALGSIMFLDDVPEPAIVMYPNAILDLVSNTTVGSYDRPLPAALRDVVHGRVLGRALAHEIGHFLLRSRGHSPYGLMRAHQPVGDLVSPDRHRFTLSAEEVTHLAATVSMRDIAAPSAVQSVPPRRTGAAIRRSGE